MSTLVSVPKLKLSDFDLAEVIGQGHTALVHKAYWKSKKKIVAVKKLKFNSINDLDRMANRLETARHTNVVEIFGFIENN